MTKWPEVLNMTVSAHLRSEPLGVKYDYCSRQALMGFPYTVKTNYDLFYFTKIALVCLHPTQYDAFMPNLVQIGGETVDKSCPPKKKIRQRIVIRKFLKIELHF